jgi:hypothetical protein
MGQRIFDDREVLRQNYFCGIAPVEAAGTLFLSALKMRVHRC